MGKGEGGGHTAGVETTTIGPPSGPNISAEIVGHKTFSDGHGGFYHEPLTRSEADEMLARIDARNANLAELMPDVEAALAAMSDAHYRLTQLGWSDAIYCPKDGSSFEVIEPGSSGIHRAHYSGEWPTGSWWIEDAGDLWPSRPCLWRPLTPSPTAPGDGRG